MARLIDRFVPATRGGVTPAVQERYGFGQWLSDAVSQFGFGGTPYEVFGRTLYGRDEGPVLRGERQALPSNGVVYAVVRKRIELFSQVEFKWKRLGTGPTPMAADMFTNADLAPLDHPMEMLAWMELDVATAGNSYWVLDGGRLRRLPPQWVTVVAGTRRYAADEAGWAWDAEPLGIVYQPDEPGASPELFLAGEYAHYRPEFDPDARWRGMSYLRPVLADVQTDNSARRFLTKFFDSGATPNMAAVFPPEVTKETVEAFRDLFLQRHAGVENAFRTAFFGGGVDLKMIGSNLKDLDNESIRLTLHEDICVAAGVDPLTIGIMRGTYQNSKESNRKLADTKIRFLWLAAVEALRPLLRAPDNGELWYDPTRVAALQADALDDAQVMVAKSNVMRTLVDGGFEPDSVVAMVVTGDATKLKHTKLVPVQLNPMTSMGDDGSNGSAEPVPVGDGASGSEASSNDERLMDAAMAAQRLYLAVVNRVITVDEARWLLRQLGFDLGEDGPVQLGPVAEPEPEPVDA